MTFILLAIAVMAATTTVDFAHARYVRAMMEERHHAAARWSVAQWLAASVGFVVAVRVTLWMLPFEAVGLYLGTLIGARQKKSSLPRARARTRKARPRVATS